MLVGGGWASHRSFLRSRDPRLARYIESSLWDDSTLWSPHYHTPAFPCDTILSAQYPFSTLRLIGTARTLTRQSLRSTFILIRSPSLSPTLIAYSFTYQSLRVTLISPLLRYRTIKALQTSLQISIRTSISNCPLSPSTFSIFGRIIIIYPDIVFRGVGSLCCKSAAIAAQVRFAGKGGFYLFLILLSRQRI